MNVIPDSPERLSRDTRPQPAWREPRRARPPDPPQPAWRGADPATPDQAARPAPPAWLAGRLQKGESLLWWGRPRATWWFPAWPATTLVGLAFLGFTFGVPFAKGEAPSFETGQIVIALFGLALLLAPLWNFLGLRTVVYAVTDLRAIRGSRLLALSVWGSSIDNRFLRPWLSTDAQGRKNVLFTKVQINNASRSSPHIRYRPDGFHHLSPADADAALAALRVCYAHTEDLRRLNRKTEGPRSGSWQTEEYVEFPRARVPKGAKSTFGI